VYESSGDNLIGANFMMNHDVTFNLDRHTISIAKAVCGRPITPMHTPSPSFRPSMVLPPTMPPWNATEHFVNMHTSQPTVQNSPTEVPAHVWHNPTPGAVLTNTPTIQSKNMQPTIATMAPTINRSDPNRSSSPTTHRDDRWTPGSVVNPDGTSYTVPGGSRQASMAPSLVPGRRTPVITGAPSVQMHYTTSVPTIAIKDGQNNEDNSNVAAAAVESTTAPTTAPSISKNATSITTISQQGGDWSTRQLTDIVGIIALVLVILCVCAMVIVGALSRVCGYKAKISFHRIQDEFEDDHQIGPDSAHNLNVQSNLEMTDIALGDDGDDNNEDDNDNDEDDDDNDDNDDDDDDDNGSETSSDDDNDNLSGVEFSLDV